MRLSIALAPLNLLSSDDSTFDPIQGNIHRNSRPMHRKGSKAFQPAPTSLSEITPVLDSARSRLVPFALWVLLLAWTARVTIFIRQRSETEFADVDVLAAVEIFIVFVVLVTVLVSARVLPLWSKTAGTSVRILFYYYILSAISASWSPLPEYSLYRAFEFIVLLMGVLVALSYAPNFLKAERAILIVSTIVIVFSMYVIVNVKGLSLSSDTWQRSLSSDTWQRTLHTNSYSASAAILFCYCLGEYFQSDKNRRKALKWFGLFAFAALALGTSASSNVAATFGVLLVAVLSRNVMMFVICGFLLILFLSISFLGVIDFDGSVIKVALFPGKTEEQIYSLHGRLAGYKGLLRVFYDSPIIGHGFAVLTTVKGYVFSNAPHNSLLSVLLGTGLVGMLPVLVYVFRTLRELLKTVIPRRPGSIGCAAAIVTGLVNSQGMPLVLDEWEESTLVFICVTAFSVLFVYLPHKFRQNERKMEILRQRANAEA